MGRELEGWAFVEEGKTAGGVTDDTEPRGSLTGSDRPADDAGASCAGSWLPKICHFPFRKPPALGGFSGTDKMGHTLRHGLSELLMSHQISNF